MLPAKAALYRVSPAQRCALLGAGGDPEVASQCRCDLGRFPTSQSQDKNNLRKDLEGHLHPISPGMGLDLNQGLHHTEQGRLPPFF